MINRTNHVWSTDITYVPLARGFVFLVVVIDWYSRCVLSWRLSNTMDMSFCIEALEDAFQFGKPEIFNTDQGSLFTSPEYTQRLLSRTLTFMQERLEQIDTNKDGSLVKAELEAGMARMREGRGGEGVRGEKGVRPRRPAAEDEDKAQLPKNAAPKKDNAS